MPPLDISRLGWHSFISQNALSEVLTAIRESGEIPQSCSRPTVKRRRERGVQVETPYGELLQTFEFEMKEKGVLTLPFCHPAAFLYHASAESVGMRRLLSKASSSSVAHPLKIVIYGDEISPGNH